MKRKTHPLENHVGIIYHYQQNYFHNFIIIYEEDVVNMFEKEIKQVSGRTTKTISLGATDGDVKLGKCFIVYPEELEEIKKDNQYTQRLHEEIKTLKTQLTTQERKHKDTVKTLKQLEDENTKKDEAIQQLEKEKDDLNYSVDGLNSKISSMNIRHEEEIKEVTSKYNSCVELIHSLITTTSLIKNEIQNLGLTKRTLHYKQNINHIYEERNMDILINQHLLQEDSTIPEKRISKQ